MDKDGFFNQDKELRTRELQSYSAQQEGGWEGPMQGQGTGSSAPHLKSDMGKGHFLKKLFDSYNHSIFCHLSF